MRITHEGSHKTGGKLIHKIRVQETGKPTRTVEVEHQEGDDPKKDLQAIYKRYSQKNESTSLKGRQIMEKKLKIGRAHV